MAKLFEPDFCQEIFINNRKLDFVRYLAILFQYQKDFKINNLAKNYGKKMEEYYEKFIYSTVGKDSSLMFENLTIVFPDKKFEPFIDILKESVSLLEIKDFSSIIEADMYFTGLVYIVFFAKKNIDIDRKDNLKNELNLKIDTFKKDYSHAKTPSLLTHLRNRINSSIEIYRKYLK